MPRKLSNSSTSSSSSKPSTSTSRSRPPPPAAAFTQDESDLEAEQSEDSEEDEWDLERTNSGKQSNSVFQQDEDESESEEDSEDGMAAYESDQGEVIEEEDMNEEEAIQNQLASIPFTSLLKAQKQLSKSTAHASRKGKGRATSDSDAEEEEGERGKKGKGGNKKEKFGKKRDVEGRSNKHAPTEMSTKRPVSRTRQIVETTTKKSRDPRFDSLSGSVNPELFARSYGFLSGSLQSELDTLRQTAAKARKNPLLPAEDLERIEDSLSRMENRFVERKRKEREQAAMKDWKKEEKEKRKEGKGAFYLKETEKKKLFLKAKFDELSQDKRKLGKAMDKKRRKTSQKEKKQMPRTR
ncbi:hypothetical protein JCM5353_000545 [Sporobolomyces roseus]